MEDNINFIYPYFTFTKVQYVRWKCLTSCRKYAAVETSKIDLQQKKRNIVLLFSITLSCASTWLLKYNVPIFYPKKGKGKKEQEA